MTSGPHARHEMPGRFVLSLRLLRQVRVAPLGLWRLTAEDSLIRPRKRYFTSHPCPDSTSGMGFVRRRLIGAVVGQGDKQMDGRNVENAG